MKKAAVLLLSLCLASAARADLDPALALQLFADGDYQGSAVEFRRLALAADSPAKSAGWYWMAARAYAGCGLPDSVDACLSRADSLGGGLAAPSACLRGELAYADGEWAEAGRHFQRLEEAAPDDPGAVDFAVRFRAAAALREGDAARARETALRLPEGDSRAEVLAALDGYAGRPLKKPWLGGVLGLVPGLGHVYAGEYANGFRSLVLNGLFIWAMVETAEEDQWALFSVAAFGELTWYSGSVYGGIDAVERRNAALLEEAALRIEGPRRPFPDLSALPLVRLQFEF